MATLAAYLQERLAEDGHDLDVDQLQEYLDAHAALGEEASEEASEEVRPAKKTAKVAAKGKAVAKGKAAPVTKVAPKAKTAPVAKGKVAPKAKTSKSKEVETHTCERLIKGKDAERICGKNAKNELNDMWYCGTEKSGCYSSALKAASAAPKKGSAKAAPKGKTAPKGKPAKVVQKVVKKEKLNLTEVPDGSGIWVDLVNYRMVYSQSPKETYGILDDDDETVLPLTEEAIDFAESHNIPVRVKAKGKAVSKAAPKSKVAPKGKVAPKSKAKPAAVESEEEVLEDLAQEVEDVEVAEDLETPDIDLGEDEAPEVEEADEEAGDEPDIEEADEGEAADDADPEEEDAPDDEE